MQPASALLLWLFLKSAALPHEPVTLATAGGELPASRSVYGWLETTSPQMVSDRFDSGGLTIGTPARIGVHGTSAADTTFRIGGLDATSTLRPGTPMVLPDVVGASSIDLVRIASDARISAPGSVVSWEPLTGDTRIGVVEGFFMPTSWAIDPIASTTKPPIQQLRSLADGSLLLGGALSPGKSNAVLAAHWARARRLDRGETIEKESTLFSAIGHVTFTPNATDRTSVLLIAQRATRPLEFSAAPLATESDAYGTAQVTWERAPKAGLGLRVIGGYQWMNIDMASAGPTNVVRLDSALGGSIFPQLFRPAGSERVLRLSADVSPAVVALAGAEHHINAGASIDASSMTPTLSSASSVEEYVNGTPARVWSVVQGTGEAKWRSTTFALFAQDRITLGPHAWLEAGIRYEKLGASAGAAGGKISWSNWYPHAALDVTLDEKSGLGLYATFTRAGARLPAMALGFGDAAAPYARVYRWSGARDTGGAPLLPAGDYVSRIGPGAGAGTTIDPSVLRPAINQFVGGFRIDKPRVAFSVSAIVRLERDFVRAVATGGAAYTTVTQPDQFSDFTSASDDRVLTGYSRTPSSFGLDAYTLMNPIDLGEGSSYSLDISAQARSRYVRAAFSAAAVKAEGASASRGFRPDENDAGLIGDVLMNPNATTYAAGGRNFFDRGYVGKIMLVAGVPGKTTFAIATRYQDGQPFSRLAIISNLNQGPEAVMAYQNGRPTRFTYISTTDVRLQAPFSIGSGRLTVIVDAFNVFNIGREVEEHVLNGADFRAVSAIEPPRTIRLGLRFAF
jgi:hypothetical protein